MKVALVNPTLVGPTGGERQILRLAIELQKMGHEADIFTNKVDREMCFPDLISQVNIKLVPYPVKCPLFYYNIFLGMWKISGEIAKKKYDVIYINNYPSEWVAFFNSKKTSIPTVWMCNEPPFWYFLPEDMKNLRFYNRPLNIVFDKISVRAVDKIIALSELMGSVIKKTYGRNYEIIRTGIDLEQFQGVSEAEFRKKNGLEDKFLLLQVGYISHYKRNDDSVRALSILSKKHENMMLVFVGDGDAKCKERLVSMVNKKGLQDRVLFLGPLPDDELKQAYAACDVFLFPAFQSWSLVATEAMSCKKPVIVSDMCGVSEIITSGINGFVVKHGDYSGMAERIELLAGDESLRRKMGENAFLYLKDNLSWEKYAEDMVMVFKDVNGL